jgi:UDP-N-acetylmuramoyl-tripeptide--D-alanyl-D-alanine ligase
VLFRSAYGIRKARLRIPFFTENSIQNFLAAAGVAYGMSLGLEEVTARAAELKPFPRRGILYRLKKDIVLVDDSYNSNPRAVEAALRGLARLPAKRRVAVLGDMLELGCRAPEFHSQAGKDVVAAGWHRLVTIGPLSRHTAEAALQAGLEPNRCLSLADADEACRRVPDLIEPGDLVLVKGSRGMRTDRVADKILEVYKES